MAQSIMTTIWVNHLQESVRLTRLQNGRNGSQRATHSLIAPAFALWS